MALPASRRGVHPDMVDRNGNIKFPKDVPEYGASDAGKNLSVKTGGTGLEWKEETKELPARTVADAGKVLTVGEDGSLGWEEKQGGGGEWKEFDSNPNLTSVGTNGSGGISDHQNGRTWYIDLGEDNSFTDIFIIGKFSNINFTMRAYLCDEIPKRNATARLVTVLEKPMLSADQTYQFASIRTVTPRRYLCIGSDYNYSAEGITANMSAMCSVRT